VGRGPTPKGYSTQTLITGEKQPAAGKRGKAKEEDPFAMARESKKKQKKKEGGVEDPEAGGALRTSSRPMSNILPLLLLLATV
jgi:hypothetical protein